MITLVIFNVSTIIDMFSNHPNFIPIPNLICLVQYRRATLFMVRIRLRTPISFPAAIKKNYSKKINVIFCKKLVLNYSKTFQVLFKAPNKKFNSLEYIVNLSNTTLELKNETKFLGITLDSNITF